MEFKKTFRRRPCCDGRTSLEYGQEKEWGKRSVIALSFKYIIESVKYAFMHKYVQIVQHIMTFID